MQNPYEDTEWNDALRKAGILPEVQKAVAEEWVPASDKPVKPTSFANQDEEDAWMDDNGDDEDFIREYRERRMNEIQLASMRPRFGEVREITGQDYIQEVNKAGADIWVVLLLYRQGHPQSTLLADLLGGLSAKFPEVKFLKSISTLCIPNYPDENLPTMFVYHNEKMISNLVGPMVFGAHYKITADEVEWILSKTGCLKTTLESDPRKSENQSRKFYESYDSDED